ncbi:glycogen branching protein [Pseudomonas neustonica]|uniref:Glycogen branching protein n=1 Tax=Pseudomonas neustonica TaxID=2487346 RepID=A0ABX9XEN0_9PSED|nr:MULTISPECIES: glycogen branching protein [Pseudomonas]ROZ80897.1 glycogen branching protein [Pseudomonas sp. SSM44]ROZ82094.1 glycogen branching protein [Pseudomonas neustonica]|tara:strand:- start:6399 stop:6596 length:198 start_codon:yes stop_codon:yes gene_type:complete
MPKHNVTQAFHYATGGAVLLFKKGEQDLPPAVAEHAIKHGFVSAPKSLTDKQTAAPAKAEPAAKQ